MTIADFFPDVKCVQLIHVDENFRLYADFNLFVPTYFM
jgi:hypothetical protein